LVLAPHGRDAAVAVALLRESGIDAAVCADLAGLAQAIDEETSFLLLAEEALEDADLRTLAARLDRQRAWSDLPVIVLSRRTLSTEQTSSQTARLEGVLGNVTFLERPFHPSTFASVARSTLKARLRQYETRSRVEELRESEERLRTALVAGRLGSWELDLATRRLTASPACKAQFGRCPDDSFGYDDLIASIHPDDRERMSAAVQATLDSGEDLAGELRSLWSDGSLHWLEVRARLVRGRQGGRPRLVGVSSDITERKTAEERLRRLNESLEERVAARTGELVSAHAARLAEIEQRERAERQLRHAQKMEMVGQLTGGVAHDFNNLLMAVLGNLQLLRKRVPADPKLVRLIEGALQGAQRGAALTQRLLAFAHQQELRVEPVDLVQLMLGMADLIEKSINPKIELRFRLPDKAPIALADANQVELAVLNLVVNARDAMPEGGQLSLSVDRRSVQAGDSVAPGLYAVVAVTDSGHGMDADTLMRAAEPFFSTKELGKGTGLGLSMIHGLAVQLGGALRLASEVGKGTVAEFWMPAAEATPISSPNPAVPAPFRGKQHALSILLVDDDVLVAMSTADMLEDLGHRVLRVASPEEGLEVLRADTCLDLLITDYAMPRMNGGQLAKAARALRPDLPILLATGYAELPPGGSLSLPRIGKPYQQDQLAAAIDAVLRDAGKPSDRRAQPCAEHAPSLV